MTILTLTIVEVGSMFFAYNDMHNTAREAVRRAAVDERLIVDERALPTDPLIVYSCDGSPGVVPAAGTVAAYACNRSAGWIKDYEVETEIDTVSEASLSCRTVKVRLSTTLDQLAPFDVFGILAGKTVVTEATMVTEYTVGGANFCT